jgi:hypothetical protein
MAYSHVSKKNGVAYFLHARVTPTTNGTRTMYFFAKEVKASDGTTSALDTVPAGYAVVESEATGLPLLKKA